MLVQDSVVDGWLRVYCLDSRCDVGLILLLLVYQRYTEP